MRQAPDTDPIHACFRHASDGLQSDSSGGFQQCGGTVSIPQLDGLSKLLGRHVVEQYDFWLFSQRIHKLLERIDFDLNRCIPP